MALNSQGSSILHSSSGTGDSPAAYTAIEQVTNIAGPDGRSNLIDVSHLGSSRKEFLPGLADNGQIQVTANFTGGTKQMEMFDNFNSSADPEQFRIDVPTARNASTYHHFWFLGIVTSWSLSEAVDAKVVLTMTIQTSGGVTYTTGA
jgi:hypothetical protein